MRVRVLLAVLCLLGGSPSIAPVRAQSLVERARAHFEAGRVLYDHGEYAGALREFREGYALAPRPRFLVNEARCLRRLGRLQEARDAYRRFLAAVPEGDAADRAEAQADLDELEAEVRKSAPAAATGSAGAPRRSRLVPAWAMLGVTLGFGAAALGTGVGAAVLHDELKTTCASEACTPDRLDGLHASTLAADVLIGMTAAAAITATVLFVIGARRAPARAALAASPGGSWAF